MTWTTPKNWQTGEALTASDMNTHIRDNLNALKSPPTDSQEIDESTDVTYSTTSTWADVDATNLEVEITTTGGDVMIGFAGSITNTVVDTAVYLDVVRDPSGTPTRFAGDDGLLAITAAKAAYAENASFVILWTGLSGGTHTFRLQWMISAGTAKFWRGQGGSGTNFHAQFWAREV